MALHPVGLIRGLLKGSMDELGKINRFCPNPCFLPHIWKNLIAYSIILLSKEYEAKLKARRDIFAEATGCGRGMVIKFITPCGVAKGLHSTFLHSQLTAKHLFAEILGD